MKKTILLSSLFAAAAAVAGEVPSGNAIAALDKDIGNSAAQTLLAVPFEGYEEADKVKVADIVKTSGLADGSKLYVPNADRGYDTWKLESGKWVPGVKVSVGENGEVGAEKTGSASDVEINRGDAFWLEPKFLDGGTTGTVFLLGQGDGTSGTSTVDPGWNLVGNASAGSRTFDFVGSKLDEIIVQVDGKLRYYTYKSGKGWRYQMSDGNWSTPTTVDADKLVISAGQGFWYNNNGDSEATINW